MTSQGNGPLSVYKVTLSAQAKKTVKQLHLQALQAGKSKEYLQSLRYVYERLRRDPLDFGEPLYRLPVLKMTVYLASAARMVVDYAVHEEQPLVFVRGLKILP